ARGRPVSAVGPRRHWVRLVASTAYFRSRVVALAARRITAGRARRLETVVGAGPVAVALVLVRALGPRVAAVGPRGHVVGLAGACALAGTRLIAIPARRIYAVRSLSLETV